MALVCTNLQISEDSLEHDDGRVLFRWKCNASDLDHFDVLAGYYSIKQNGWVQDDSTMSADTNNVDGWYQHHWTCPDANVAIDVRFYIRPVTKWTDSDDKQQTSYGAWQVSGAFRNPKYTAHATEQDKYKYKCITDRPDKPTMAVEANAAKTSVTLKFSTEAPRAGAIEVQRRMDGGSWAFLHLIERTFPNNDAGVHAPLNDQPRWPETGTLNYADSAVQPGHAYEYRARVRNMETGYKQTGPKGRLQFNAPINGGPIRGLEGDFCDPASVTTKPARPTFHEAKLSGPQSVRLLWVENGKNTDHYDVQYSSYRSADNQNAWNAGAYNEISHMNVPYPAPKVTVDGKSYSVATVSGLSYGTLYDFRVYCVNADGDEAVSIFTGSDGKSYGTRSVKVPAEPAPTITKPKSVSGKEASGVARVTWSCVLEAGASFVVEHSLRSDAWDYNIADAIDTYTDYATYITDDSWIFSKSDLEKGKTHYFRVCKVLGNAKVVGTPAKVKVAIPAQTVDTSKNPANFAGSVVNGNARLTWNGDALGDGESYQLQYSSDPSAFSDNILDSISEATLDESGGTSHVLTVTGLDEGTTYWFRARWRSGGSASGWVSGVKLKIPPSAETLEQLSAPTVSTTNMSYMLDEQVPLGWTHNSGDDTDQSAWQVQLGGSVNRTIDSDAETASNPAIVLALSDPTYGLSDGDYVTWKVRTQGAWPGYWSPWSRTQAFDVYARPVATMSVEPNPVTSFPMTIEVGAVSQGGGSLPTGNRPLSCSVSIAPAEATEVVDPDGTARMVAEGESIWSGYYTNEQHYSEGGGWSIPLDASDVVLSGAVQYKASATVTTMQGMRCEVSALFSCEWDAEVPAPRANVAFDRASLSCRIYPWCEELLGYDQEGQGIFQLREGTELSVYRVNQDGSTELVAENVPNDGESYVDDPHCAFGTCTYRIVARDAETGVQSSDDYQVETAYDRVVVEFGAEQVDLKYNVEWTEEHAPDVELLNFHGRKHPVAHWGTQRDQTFVVRGSLIRGTDAGTLAKLRRLAEHRGACYVREPTGLAWWANVVPRTVSGGYGTAEQKVELEITRIEA